uniref:Uncharacterized protein n=1 Tax=viral metagenome TaxID=1070528 RepID=A0A6H2A566_9ZZZZ
MTTADRAQACAALVAELVAIGVPEDVVEKEVDAFWREGE